MRTVLILPEKLQKKRDFLWGYTSGAALQAVRQLNQHNQFFDKDSVVVVIFCDHGSRYMSKIYSDKWMKDQGFLMQTIYKMKRQLNTSNSKITI